MEETVRKCDWCGKHEEECLEQILVSMANGEDVCAECLGIRPTRKRPSPDYGWSWINTSATPYTDYTETITNVITLEE